jgi:hypothetical protein
MSSKSSSFTLSGFEPEGVSTRLEKRRWLKCILYWAIYRDSSLSLGGGTKVNEGGSLI